MYVCTVRLMHMQCSEHFIRFHADPYVNFLNGNEYTVEIWKPIVIQFAYIFNEATDSTFTITQNGNTPSSFEYTSGLVADKPFTAEIIINRPILSSNDNGGQYDVTVTLGSQRSSFPFTINVLSK